MASDLPCSFGIPRSPPYFQFNLLIFTGFIFSGFAWDHSGAIHPEITSRIEISLFSSIVDPTSAKIRSHNLARALSRSGLNFSNLTRGHSSSSDHLVSFIALAVFDGERGLLH